MGNDSVIRNGVFNIIKTSISMLFPIITFAYVSRVLGAEGIGKVNFSQYCTSFFAYIAQLGVPVYATRELAKRKGKRDKISKFAHEMLFINCISTIFALILLIVVIIFIDRFHDYILTIAVFALTIITQGMGMEWLFQGMMDFRYIFLRTLAFQCIALVLLFTTVKDETDVINYAFVIVLSKSGSYIVNWFKSKKYINYKHYNNYELKRHLKPILWLYTVNLINEIYGILDTVILGFIQDDSSVGRYTAANKLGSAVIRIFSAIAVVMLPHLSIILKENNKDKFDEFIKWFFQIIFILSIPITVILFILSKEIMTLFCGAEFTSSYITMRMITLILFVVPVNIIAVNIITAIGREKANIYASIAAAGLNLILNLIFIPIYAENAAAVTTVIAESTSMVIGLINLKRYTQIKGIAKNIYQYFIASGPIVLWAFLSNMLGFTLWLKIIATVLLSMISYCIILKLFRNEFLEILIQQTLNYLIKERTDLSKNE